MKTLYLNKNADAWERLCSSENDSSTTALEVERIGISVQPPLHLLEIALSKLSQIVRFSTNLSRIELYVESENREHRVVSTVCEALIHSREQQKVEVEFQLFERMTYEQFLPVANLMTNCKREIELCIGCGEIQDEGASTLFADALRHMAGSITELILDSAGMDDDKSFALAENLKINTTLTLLDLSRNDIGDKGAEALASALKHNGALTYLSLSRNSFGKKGGVAIGHALLCNRTLKKLYLGSNAIGDEGALALAAGLRGGSFLSSLCVRGARIGKKGGVALGEALAFCPTLETLQISANLIGDEGAVVIASSLVRNARLKVLWLCRIGMRTEGCSALSCALARNTSLEDIDISGNQIGDKGAAAVADALKDNTSLKKLRMSSCNFGDDGAIALAAAIASNETLDTLELWENSDITEEVGKTALINGLNRNSTLTKLYLPQPGDHADVKFALRRNKALLEEPAWMKRFSDQNIRVKGKVLSKAMERYSMSEFSELTFLFLKSQVSTVAETNSLTHSHPTPDNQE